MKSSLSIVLFITIVFFSSCQKKPEGEITVTTKPISEITERSAKSGVSVSYIGSFSINECGICYSESSQPTIRDFYTEDGYGSGSFSSTLSNLTPQTKYYVRAYAKTSSGVKYGNQVSFTTLSGGIGLPMVTTNSVTSITANSATCGGNVTDDGGTTVTERGVCWDTIDNPIINDMHIAASSGGTGNFTVKITDLHRGTTYHVRAYAKNSNGISYGSDVSFTTKTDAPTVMTSAPTSITHNSVKVGGDVIDDGGAMVTERGICWGKYLNPTIYGSSQAASSIGLGSFVMGLTDLEPSTTYHVRAYAKNSKGTSYGSDVSFVTLPPPPPTGAINGVFTVNSRGDMVYFSQGNLQYRASSNTWRFADQQYSVIGENNTNISPNYNGWIDLFGWGTSGWDCGNTYYRPYDSDYGDGLWDDTISSGYGPSGSQDLTGDYSHSDWGVHNEILNGGNQAGLWRTLMTSEWDYIFNNRDTQSGIRFAMARVNNVCGVILLPDNWDVATYNLNNTNEPDAVYNNNTISTWQWNTLEQAGCVFLPATEYRSGTSYSGSGFFVETGCGYYWSSTSWGKRESKCLYFHGPKTLFITADPDIITRQSEQRSLGCGVRLVHPIQ